MFGSEVLDTLIALSFVYFVLSLVCSTVAELAARALQLRAKKLRAGVARMLGVADDVARNILKNPILAPARTGVATDAGPEAVERRAFAVALAAPVLAPHNNGEAPTAEEVRARLLASPIAHERETLAALLDAARLDLARWREEIEVWFDAGMAQVSTWYRRYIQWIVAAVALCVCAAWRIDTIALARGIWQNAALRDALVAQAERADPGTGGAQLAATRRALEHALGQADLIGWSSVGQFTPWSVAGILLSVAAATVGAPFWFDAMRAMLGLKKKPEAEKK